MFEVTASVDISRYPGVTASGALQAIQASIERFGLSVQAVDGNSIRYEVRELTLSLPGIGKILRSFNGAIIRCDPESRRISFTVSMRRLFFLSLFVAGMVSLFLSLVLFSPIGLLPGVIMGALVYFGNRFVSVSRLKGFIVDSLAGGSGYSA